MLSAASSTSSNASPCTTYSGLSPDWRWRGSSSLVIGICAPLKIQNFGIQRKAHGAQSPRHIFQIGEGASTAQHSDVFEKWICRGAHGLLRTWLGAAQLPHDLIDHIGTHAPVEQGF